MDETAQLGRIARGIKALTVAVWCLVAINLLQIGAWIIPFVAPNFYARQAITESVAREAFESWDGLPFEEQVKRASVVLVTENKPEQGRIRAIIKEVLKKKPDTTFYYSVGQEYGPASIPNPKPDTQYGDGSLVLLSGSPAINHGSYAIYGGSVPALGEMPLSRVKDIVANSR